MNTETTTHYNGTVTLEFDPQKHKYLLNGEKVNGVTTVLQRLNKPALIYWSANMAAKHIEATLRPGISLDEVEIKQLAKDALWAHRNTRDGAADMGTWVHQFIQDFVEGKNPQEAVNPQLSKATKSFKDWYKTINVKNQDCEKRLCSPTLKLAGTVDMICELDGKLTIIDWKTGSGIYPEMLLQMAAYALMYEEEFGQTVEQVGVVNCSVKAPFKYYFTDKLEILKELYTRLLVLDRGLYELETTMKGEL